MVTAGISKTLVYIYQTRRRHIPEDCILYSVPFSQYLKIISMYSLYDTNVPVQRNLHYNFRTNFLLFVAVTHLYLTIVGSWAHTHISFFGLRNMFRYYGYYEYIIVNMVLMILLRGKEWGNKVS
jgi:hypothetical protein